LFSYFTRGRAKSWCGAFVRAKNVRLL